MECCLFTKCLFEFIGTMVMILLGDGVCAGCTLNKSKSKGAGWIVITMAWGFAVMCGVFIAGPYSGAHLNPAVTLGLALAGNCPWSYVPWYILAQMLGGFMGAILVYVFYKDHFDATTDNPDGLLTIFCTMPAIDHKYRNFLSELIATTLLVFVILSLATTGNTSSIGGIGGTPVALGSLGDFPVTALIMAIGMSLGGTTGYAMNPARDLGPRFAHYILPLKGKGGSGWAYSWVPIVGPLTGACLAAALFLLIFP